MARPSTKPTVRDDDDAGGVAEAAADGGEKSSYSFCKGDIVEGTWGKRNKRMKYAATVLEIDHSKRAQPVHVQFGADGNAWVSAGSVVKDTNGAVACEGTLAAPHGPNATLSAGGDLAAKADLVYKSSQHCRSNKAVGGVPATDMDGLYEIDPRTNKPYLATYVARHGVEPQASSMTAVAPAIGETGLFAGGVRRGGVKGMKPVGSEVRLQGGVKSVFVDCCGMCGRVGSRNRELRECRWTPPCWLVAP
jgi:hypothetical protein